MKDIKEVLNLPVVSIKDGEEIAVIKSAIINCDNKAIEYLIIEKKDNRQILLEAVPYSEVKGIGCYAVTIDSSSSIVSLDGLKLSDRAFKNHDEILSQKIITSSGDYVGTVLGFNFEEETGAISSIVFKDNTSEDNVTQKDELLTIGNRLLIIKSSKYDNKNVKPAIKKTVDLGLSNKKTSGRENFSRRLDDKISENVNNYKENFVNHQEDSAIGKILKKDIVDYRGNTLLYKNTKITKEILDKIKDIDESLVFEIFASI